MANERHALDVFPGEGFSSQALLHGSPKSVLAIETRKDKREQFARVDKLKSSSQLDFPEVETLSGYISQLDTEGFQLVHVGIPENLDEVARSENISVEKLMADLLYHGMRCCSINGYLIVSGSCFMTTPTKIGPIVCESLRKASVELRRSVQKIRVVQPGPDIQANSSSSVYTKGSDESHPYVGIAFKV
eukprot:CAMPEP_0201531754 /NCGR_PEP_ID=MMETSP0161_2-20130828/48527_1 /ASSEMBLY_ACC=CAM_ASM_000251 /TAXON_ID=180227 /ORGANISM="Neoparamoeba aestuarina, Strain SoJaBio B1-5/56/2" /LENGTH=188 /DNA_ID=CAMNT_0047934821 /DNA_START=122 /DNA_END=688 /DNA_ORIENTATION=-